MNIVFVDNLLKIQKIVFQIRSSKIKFSDIRPKYFIVNTFNVYDFENVTVLCCKQLDYLVKIRSMYLLWQYFPNFWS